MNRSTRPLLAFLVTLSLSACGLDGRLLDDDAYRAGDPDEVPAANTDPDAIPETPAPPQTAPPPTVTLEDLRITGLLNDRTQTDVERLTGTCGVRDDSAENLIAHRDGPDGVGGTDDDDLFDTIQEVEAVYWVGEGTVDRLLGCAEDLGYAPSYDEAAALLMLNDALRTDVHRLDRICGIRSDAARNLVAHRDGVDGLPATADDDRFDAFGEIDDVLQVGPWTLDRLVSCADRLGYATVDAAATPLGDLIDEARGD